MDARNVIRHMCDWSKMSKFDISRSMGKSRNYLSVMLTQRKIPRVDNFVRIANACGFRVFVRDNSYQVEVTAKADDDSLGDVIDFLAERKAAKDAEGDA